ncbi:MAG: hypothetical protein ABR881_30120 [Candidatus Sulfotelmatobacter sp.]|jgi:hypothetical protein
MKHRVIATLFVLGLLAVAGNAHAQTITFKAHVPFPFVLGNQTLPAGTYQVQRLLGRPREADQVGMIVMRSTIPRVYKAVVTNLVRQPLDSNSSSQLVFANRGGQHYLAEVHMQGEKNHQIPNVSRESELARPDVSQEEVVLAELH